MRNGGGCAHVMGLALLMTAVTSSYGAVALPSNGRYEQHFDSLTWANSTSGFARDFGTQDTDTLGWAFSGYNASTPSSLYRYYTTGSGYPSSEGLYSYRSQADSNVSVTPVSQSSSRSIGLFLQNPTDHAINTVTVEFTLKLLWKSSTSSTNVSGAISFASGVSDTCDSSGSPSLWPQFGDYTHYGFTSAAKAGDSLLQSFTLSNLEWNPNENLVLVWVYSSTLKSNQIVGLDDVIVHTPEPSSVLSAASVAGLACLRRQRRTVASPRTA